MLAEDAENNQPGGKHAPKTMILPVLVLKKFKKFAGFHGWPLGERMGCTGALVTVTTGGGGGGERRVTSTVNCVLQGQIRCARRPACR